MINHMNIKDVWEHIEENTIINWHHQGYRIAKQKANNNNEYEVNHHSYKDGYILAIVHEEGHQSILQESEMKDLYI